MKKKLLLFALWGIGMAAHAQPRVKVFAFEQDNLPGARAAGVKDENGNPVEKAAAKKNYFIFLSYSKKCTISPIRIGIKGKEFDIAIVQARTTPVENTSFTISNRSQKTILVPKTGNKVVQLVLAEAKPMKNKDAHLQKLAETNEVVISYRWNKKKYVVVQKRIGELEPVANE